LECREAGTTQSSNSGCKLGLVCALSLAEQPELDPSIDSLFGVSKLQGEQLDAFTPTLPHQSHISATPISMAQDALVSRDRRRIGVTPRLALWRLSRQAARSLEQMICYGVAQ
jgi:hypothetical protein